MRLKDFQTDVLEALSRYLALLSGKRAEAQEILEFQRSKGRAAVLGDYCRDTWESLHQQGALPLGRGDDGKMFAPPYIARVDGLGRPIPNICLKIPTGGGKTLLGCAAVEQINGEYFKKQTGLLLWVVPSDAIYTQTWKAFANREHPYRQMLERASGGRVKLLERTDNFTKQDVDEYLCVMLLMLQASARRTKDQLKMFRTAAVYAVLSGSGRFAGSVGTQRRSAEPGRKRFDRRGIPQRWADGQAEPGNVLRLVRPVIVIDEGTRRIPTRRCIRCAASIRGSFWNCRQPQQRWEDLSNVVGTSRDEPQDEEMIKLPINLVNEGRPIVFALASAKEQLTI
jgi:type III restriction enzyme